MISLVLRARGPGCEKIETAKGLIISIKSLPQYVKILNETL